MSHIRNGKYNKVFIRTSNGLYRSDDNLQSWNLIPTTISKFEFHPNNPNIMYAYSGNSFYISNDAGSSFNLQSTMPVAPSFISLSSDCSNCIYLLSSYDGMWKSLDQGLNFTFMDSCIIPSYANWKGGFAVNDIDTSNIIYGGTEKNQKISLSKKIVKILIEKENFLSNIIELSIDGKSESVLPREITYDVVTDEPTHIDFLRIVKGGKVILKISVLICLLRYAFYLISNY